MPAGFLFVAGMILGATIGAIVAAVATTRDYNRRLGEIAKWNNALQRRVAEKG